MIGLLQAQWSFTGYDASAHTIEETVNPCVRVPWGIFNSVAYSFVFGFIMLAFVTLSMHDVSGAASASNGFIFVISQALGETFGAVVLWLVTFTMWFCGLSSITSFSRHSPATKACREADTGRKSARNTARPPKPSGSW